jgi:pyruvate dehydrogenase E2 component (dihydrolipoamide acetyltransferase)
VPVEVIMPMLGMAQETGKVLRWLKAEGEPVTKAEPLMEVETDKVTVEIEAPAAGTLAGVSAAEGEDVPVGRVIAYVLAAGEQLPATRNDRDPAPGVAAAAAAAAAAARNDRDPAPGVARRQLASPKARRLARERGVPLHELAGSGPHGAVVAADVESFAAGAQASPAAAAPSGIDVSTAWKTMARRMAASWQEVPHFYLSREVDATRLDGWRDAVRRRAGYEGVTHTDLLVKIAAAALLEHPRVNASWQGGGLTASGRVNVGIAVATDDALVVPVLHDADRLELRQIAEQRADLVTRARERKLRLDDLESGTFTISNLGMFGIDSFGAVVNAPQAAILAVGRIADRVVAVDGAAAVRPTFALTLSLDHRAIDGAMGARFLDTLVSLVEEPAGLVS